MCMEPLSTMILAKCYKATVNESETINDAQPFCLVRGRSETSGLGATGFGFPVVPPIERS
jgi:hypothetical protein